MNGPMHDPGLHPLAQTGGGSAGLIDSERLIRAARRRAGLIGRGAAIGGLVALALILGSVPRYSAMETILLDEERAELLNQVSAMPNEARSDAAVQSEIEILGSQVLALEVVERLELHEDAAFMDPPVDLASGIVGGITSTVEWVSDLLSPPVAPPASDKDPVQAQKEWAAALLREHVRVERVGRSFVMRLYYSDPDPVRAAAVANAYGEAYVAYQLGSSAEVAATSGQWINDRLKQVAAQMLKAESDVQTFRARHNLVQFQGSLLTEQQQSDLATALITASAEEAQIRARLDQFRELLATGDVIAVSALETLTPSDVSLASMRTSYLDTRRRWTAIAGETGEDHPQAQRLMNEMRLLEQAIGEELDRAAKAIEANHKIAVSRVASLRDDLKNFSENANSDVELVGELAQLEAIAETYASVYRDYLERFEIAAQQENFPIASVRIISPAEVPLKPSSPQKKIMLALGLILGAIIGLVIAAAREMGPARLRTLKDVRDGLGLPVAGLMPVRGRGYTAEASRIEQRTLARLKRDIDRSVGGTSGRVVALVPAETGGDPQAIPAICEALAADGDAVLAVNAGGLTPGMAQRINTLKGVELWKASDLHGMLPRSRASKDGGAGDLRNRYRFVLLCLPALTSGGFPDAFAAAADTTVVLVPWGQVTPDLLREALVQHGDTLRPVATTVLTGADLKRARLYMRPGDYEERLLHAV